MIWFAVLPYSHKCLIWYVAGVFCLKNVVLVVPTVVKAGTTLHLACKYELDGAPLYSVKFYQGDQEFYRYVPKDAPPTKVFPLPAVQVDVSGNFLNC